LGIERREEVRRPLAEFRAQDVADLLEGHAGSSILQLRQLGHVVGREEIGARAERLAELDGGGPETARAMRRCSACV
jgi:hypothetical protein